jgi:hypothetical protein
MIMAEITGEITATFGGTSYRLVLGMRGLALLQAEYGLDLAPILGNPGEAPPEDPAEGVDPAEAAEPDAAQAAQRLPDIGALIRVVEVSLARYHPNADPYLGSDLLQADMSLAPRLIFAAIPQGDEDAAPAPPPVARQARVAAVGKSKAAR